MSACFSLHLTVAYDTSTCVIAVGHYLQHRTAEQQCGAVPLLKLSAFKEIHVLGWAKLYPVCDLHGWWFWMA
jgi:hypothetical protein